MCAALTVGIWSREIKNLRFLLRDFRNISQKARFVILKELSMQLKCRDYILLTFISSLLKLICEGLTVAQVSTLKTNLKSIFLSIGRFSLQR
jgi:hypothetical protein